MKKLATAIAAIALIGTPAFAADMAVKAPPPPPAPIYNWTGWYVGGNIGFGWGDADTSFYAAAYRRWFRRSVTHNAPGYIQTESSAASKPDTTGESIHGCLALRLIFRAPTCTTVF